MNKIWIVDSICFDRRSVCDTDGAWSYHKTKEGAIEKMNALKSNSDYDNYDFSIKEVNLED